MARGCKRYLDFEESYYPDHTCITTGQVPCDVCLVQEQIPAFEAEISALKSKLAAQTAVVEAAKKAYGDLVANAPQTAYETLYAALAALTPRSEGGR